MKLSAEPSGSRHYRIIAGDDRPVFGTVGGGHEKPFSAEEIAANARRLVACWNACEDISTEDLEHYYNAGGGIDEALEEACLQDHALVVQQRNLLLLALWKIAQTKNIESTHIVAHEAISKAEAA